MKHDFTYKWTTQDLNDYLDVVDVDDLSAQRWLYGMDDSALTEGERFNFMLAIIKWETDRGCIDEPITDELYLYFEQLTKGELDSVIDREEREEVERDLRYCFNKVFPEGLLED